MNQTHIISLLTIEIPKKRYSFRQYGADRKGQLKAKLAEIGTRDDHWRYSRNSLGVILDRYIHVYAVYEFEDGEVYLTEFYAVQNNNGAGHDDNIVVNYSSHYGDVKYSIEKWEAKTDIFTSKIGGGK